MRALLFLFVAANASAFTTGVSGYSGKGGEDCTHCHSPASVMPSATLMGPSTLAAGATATYQLVIDTDVNSGASVKRQAGFDVATSDGTLGVVNQTNQTRLIGGEISHTNALPAAKTIAIMFTLTAPASGGTVTLFAAALSADGDGSNNGDNTATTSFPVMVTAPPSPMDLAGGDFAGADLATTPPDLATPLDAISSATTQAPTPPRDAGPPKDELRWSCGSYVGVPVPLTFAPIFAIALVVFILRRRRS